MPDDIRVIAATSIPHKTSLSDFLSTATETTEEVADTSTDTEETSIVVSDEATEEDNTVETVDDEESKEYEVKGKKVKLKDLKNSFDTREEISRRFDEVGKREKRVETERERIKQERAELDFINEKFEEMREQVLAGNPLAAMQIAMALGVKEEGDKQGMEELIRQAIAIADNFHGMTEEEQKIFLEKEKLAHEGRALSRREKKQKVLDEERELQNFYIKSLNDHSITDAELDSAFEDIQKSDKFREQLENKDPKEKITYCTSWVLGKRLNTRLEAGISKVNPELVKDTQFRLALLDVIDPRCTIEDVESIVRSYVKSISGSANDKTEASTQSVAPKKPTTSDRAPTVKPKAENNAPVFTSYKDLIAKHSS